MWPGSQDFKKQNFAQNQETEAPAATFVKRLEKDHNQEIEDYRKVYDRLRKARARNSLEKILIEETLSYVSLVYEEYKQE